MRFLLAILFASCSLGQVSTARLEGGILDPSGSAVSGAAVTAINTTKDFRASTVSSEQGLYAFLSLPPGEYDLTVEAAGFRRAVLTGIILSVAATATENIHLELGPVTEAVTVRAKDEIIQRNDSHGSRVIALQDVETLPQLERYPITLALYQPGVQIAGGNLNNSRVNGTRRGSNVVKLDGVDASDPWAPALLWSLFSTTDSTQEFRMITHGAKAEYGRNAGAQIEMITRSGTNHWSGNLSNHFRNTVLNANDFFNNAATVPVPRPKFIQNIFSASLGGPLVPKRTFIFGNYQGRRARQDFPRNRDVLTPSARAGIFRWAAPNSTVIQSFDIVRNDPRGLGIDPRINQLIRLLPLPNNYDGIGSDRLNTGNFRFNAPGSGRLDQFTVRVDQHLTQPVRLFFRFSLGDGSVTDALNNNESTFPGQSDGIVEPFIASYSLGSDWMLSPRMVNELRFGHQRQRVTNITSRPREEVLVTNLWTPPVNPAFDNTTERSLYELTDNLTTVRGRHTAKLGVNAYFTQVHTRSEGAGRASGIYPNVTFARSNANIPPSTIGPSGSSISVTDRRRFEDLYNHLLGRMTQVTQTFYGDLEAYQPAGTPRLRDFRFSGHSFFLQDDWRLTPTLTLNIGLRYEIHVPPSEKNGLQGTLDKAAHISRSSQISDFTLRRADQWHQGDYNDFAPRFGFAWAPAGNAKTAIRGHYGIFFERPTGATVTLADNFTPGFSAARFVSPNQEPGSDRRVSDGIPVPEVPPAPSLGLRNERTTNIGVFDPHLRTGYVQQYAVSVQRELAPNTVLEVGFVGNRGVKLLLPVNMNQLRVQGDFLAAFREIQTARLRGAGVSGTNTLVRLFGSVDRAVSNIGPTLFDEGAAGAAADQLDSQFYSSYPAAGISDFYLRNFPQYNLVVLETNEGRTYYDSLQASLRRQSGGLTFAVNYTWSKSIDIVSTNGVFAERPRDSLNLRFNRARSDFDRPHVFSGSFSYRPPIGKNHRIGARWPGWLNAALGGWDIGALVIWESGAPFSVLSGRRTLTGDMESYADFKGDRNIGRVHSRDGGVYWFNREEISRFSAPAAGEMGTSGRNGFRGPRWFNTDLSLVKTFTPREGHRITFRSEFYNLFNNANFANPGANLANPVSLGRISETTRSSGVPVGGDSGGPRIVQLALRYEF